MVTTSIYRVGLENDVEGRSLAWVLGHPGCFAYGADGEAALEKIPQVIRAYGATPGNRATAGSPDLSRAGLHRRPVSTPCTPCQASECTQPSFCRVVCVLRLFSNPGKLLPQGLWIVLLQDIIIDPLAPLIGDARIYVRL